jgi:hypothetical protein
VSATDSPDYQEIIAIQLGGSLTDAPDWTNVVTGPGGGAVPGNTSAMDWVPSDFNLSGWSAPPWALQITANFANSTTGYAALWPVKVTTTTTVQHVGFSSVNSGYSYTANENYIGLYSVSYSGNTPNTFTLLATSAAGALEAAITPADGFRVTALSTAVSVTAGQVIYAGVVANYTGANQFYYWPIGSYFDALPTNSTVYKVVGSPFWTGPYTSLPSSLSWSTSFAQEALFPFVGIY